MCVIVIQRGWNRPTWNYRNTIIHSFRLIFAISRITETYIINLILYHANYFLFWKERQEVN